MLRLLSVPTIMLCLATATASAVTVEPGAVRLEKEAGMDVVPDEVSDNVEAQVEADSKTNKKKRNGEFVVAPLPSRSPLLGWSIGLPIMYIYKPSGSDEKDRPWVSGGAGFYTESESYGAGLFHKMSTGGDKWRLMGSAFAARLQYDYFGIGSNGDGFQIPIDQRLKIVVVEALRQSWWDNFFVGLRYAYSQTKVETTFGEGLLPGDRDPITIGRDYTLSSIIPRAVYDTRENEFYPTQGWLIEGQIGLGMKELGSDTDYEKLEVYINDYRSLTKKGVLATRIATKYIGGDAPFFLYPAFGAGADLRGYNTGTYRDRFLFSAQTEYRYRITPRNGIVGFIGIGTVADEFGKWGDSLPSVGAGYRFVLAPKNNVSLRVDIARGKDDSEFYVGIGEAF